MDAYRSINDPQKYTAMFKYLEIAIKKLNLFTRDQFQHMNSFTNHVGEYLKQKKKEVSSVVPLYWQRSAAAPHTLLMFFFYFLFYGVM
jgi:hypothetical protein